MARPCARYLATALLEDLDTSGALRASPQWTRAKAKAVEALARAKGRAFPPTWLLAIPDGAGDDALADALDLRDQPHLAAYAAALPRGAVLAHLLRCAARPVSDDRLADRLEGALAAVAREVREADARDFAAFLDLSCRDPLAQHSGDAKRDATIANAVLRLNHLVLSEFPAATRPARYGLGLFLRPCFPVAVRATVWREVGANGNLHHLRGATVDNAACAAEDAKGLVDDVLLALANDPPPDSPLVALAVNHLAAFLEAEPEGSFHHNNRILLLKESCAPQVLAALGLNT